MAEEQQTIKIESTTHRALKIAAAKQGVSMHSLVEEAIKRFLKEAK